MVRAAILSTVPPIRQGQSATVWLGFREGFQKRKRPPSMASLSTAASPPSICHNAYHSISPMPTQMVTNWITSVQMTAFMPPKDV